MECKFRIGLFEQYKIEESKFSSEKEIPYINVTIGFWLLIRGSDWIGTDTGKYVQREDSELRGEIYAQRESNRPKLYRNYTV